MIGRKHTAARLMTLVAGSILAFGPAFADEVSPKETYLNYLTAMSNAKKVEEVQPLMSQKVVAEIEKTPAAQKPMMFEFMKDTMPHDVKVLKETVNGNDAILELTGMTAPEGPETKEVTTGKVTLVKEGGMWKVERQKWESKVKVGGDDQPMQK